MKITITKIYSSLVAATVIFYLYSCSDKTATTPQDIMKKYERLVIEMKADSISQLFTNNAEVGHEGQPSIRGRDSIYKFLSSFKNVQVIHNVDSVTTVSIKNDSAVVDGKYMQTVILAEKDTIHVAGAFKASMVRDQHAGWLICGMKTRSL